MLKKKIINAVNMTLSEIDIMLENPCFSYAQRAFFSRFYWDLLNHFSGIELLKRLNFLTEHIQNLIANYNALSKTTSGDLKLLNEFNDQEQTGRGKK